MFYKHSCAVSDFISSSLQITIWKNSGNAVKEQIEVFLVSECLVFMQQIFQNGKENLKNDHEKLKKRRDYKLEDAQLILYGSKTGFITITFSIKFDSFVQQKSMGIMTEEGVRMFSLILQKGLQKSSNTQTLALKENINRLTELILKYDFSNNDYKQNLKLKEMKSLIQGLEKIFASSEKETQFQYSNVAEIVQIQNIFIDIAEIFIQVHTKLEKSLEKDFYSCFRALFMRDEFSLSSFISSDSNGKLSDEQIKVAIRLQGLFYLLIETIIDCLDEKTISIPNKSFAEYGFVHSYLHVIELRESFLSILVGHRYSVENEKKSEKINIFSNWNKIVFDKLPRENTKVMENKIILRKNLERDWFKNVQRKPAFLCRFVKELIQYVLIKIQNSEINWDEIPGYQVLISAFFNHLKSKPIQKCSEIMISTSLVVIKNTQLLNKFIMILIEKVSIRNHDLDKYEINSLFNFLNQIFGKLKVEKIAISVSLNVHIIINLMIGLIESNNVFGILHALYFMAVFGDCLTADVSFSFTKILIKYYFYKLMLHWSNSVRYYFMQFLAEKVILQFETTEQQDYAKLMIRLTRNMNLITFAKETYSTQRKNWENSKKTDRVKNGFEKMRTLVIKKIDLFDFSSLKKNNFFLLSQNFPKIQNKLFEMGNASISLNHHKIDPLSMANVQISDKNVKKVYNYQNILKMKKEERIKTEHLPYLSLSLEKFETFVIGFYMTFYRNNKTYESKWSGAETELIIDNFEVKEDY